MAERSISSSSRCLKPLFESEALMQLPSPARRRIRLAGQDFSFRKGQAKSARRRQRSKVGDAPQVRVPSLERLSTITAQR